MDTEKNIVPGTKLREARTTAGLSRKELEKMTGIGWAIIKAYEVGRRDINIARVDIVKALAQALNCSIENLLDY